MMAVDHLDSYLEDSSLHYNALLHQVDDLRREVIRLGVSLESIPVEDFSLVSAEKAAITRAIVATRGNKREASRLLQIGKSTLYRKLGLYGMREAVDAYIRGEVELNDAENGKINFHSRRDPRLGQFSSGGQSTPSSQREF